jgi:hypothetical protein
MKKILLIIIVVLCFLSFISAEDQLVNDGIELFDSSWSFIGLPDDYLYPTYLADPLAIHFEATYRMLSIDEVNPNDVGMSERIDITAGTRFSFLRFAPTDHLNLGFELDFGMSLPIFMDARKFDVLSIDGIFHFSLAVRPTDWLALRFSRHHICTHVGDELDRYEDGSDYIDYNNRVKSNMAAFVRDDYLISGIIEPLFFLGDTDYGWEKSLRLYGDFSFYAFGEDILGERLMKSFDHAYVWYQYGAELELPVPLNNAGSIYGAANISQWQMNAYAPNISLEAGYIIPQGKSGQRMRIGIVYYDGQSIMNNFNNRREQFMGFEITVEK